MAIDEVIARSADHAMLRVFDWAAPWVTFGYAQRHAQVVQVRPDLPVVRRWTGGGTVVHEGDWTFSLFVPEQEDEIATLSSGEIYAWLHGAIVQSLQQQRSNVRLATRADVIEGPVCFASPVCHDILIGTDKVAGGAQRRTKRGLLHQGSISPGIVPPGFTATLAAALARESEASGMCEEWEAQATVLAEERYAQESWNRRR